MGGEHVREQVREQVKSEDLVRGSTWSMCTLIEGIREISLSRGSIQYTII